MQVRPATLDDVPRMVELSAAKRARCAEVLPRFWKPAGDADEKQAAWFTFLLDKEDHLLLVAEGAGTPSGFLIARLMPAPPVYDPGGATVLVDDFCVDDASAWATVGDALLTDLRERVRPLGAAQIVVICAHHDPAKRSLLADLDGRGASEWVVLDLA